MGRAALAGGELGRHVIEAVDYTLAVLTHGRASPLLNTIESFEAHCLQAPTVCLCHRDGADSYHPPIIWTGAGPLGWTVTTDTDRQGFCSATHWLWALASEQDTEFVFWLEHDFRFLRPLDLGPLAEALRADAVVAQMSLIRGAANETEYAAGGLVESWPFEHVRMTTNGLPWLRHQGYFTTNPSLMRRAFMSSNPWPDYPSECEGRFGADLIRGGYAFGAWGDGEPWVEHVGERTGHGY